MRSLCTSSRARHDVGHHVGTSQGGGQGVEIAPPVVSLKKVRQRVFQWRLFSTLNWRVSHSQTRSFCYTICFYPDCSASVLNTSAHAHTHTQYMQARTLAHTASQLSSKVAAADNKTHLGKLKRGNFIF